MFLALLFQMLQRDIRSPVAVSAVAAAVVRPVLAIETATEACSLAYFTSGSVVQRHAVVPRRHNQLVFQMLDELLPGRDPMQYGLQHIAYGCGPGSFTGLRIAASFAQGLAYACDLTAVPVSTLATVAQTALHDDVVAPADSVLVLLDARINEMYSAIYTFRDGVARLDEGPWVGAPDKLSVSGSQPFIAVGSGCRYLDQFVPSLRRRVERADADLLPRAACMLPLIEAAVAEGCVQQPAEVVPVYVQEEISWKKLHEQGRAD